MNRVFKIFRFLVAAMLLAGFALPTAAQTQKLQNITMPTAIGFNRTVTVTWNNSSPPGGNSQMSSTRIDMGADAISAGWTFASAVSSTGTVAVTATSITIQKMSPVKPQKFFTVTFTLAASGLACGATGDFKFTGYTGSSLSGDFFFDQLNPTQPFSLKSATYSCESIACGGPISDTLLSGSRLENKNGGVCDAANVFTSVDAANKRVSVVSDNPNALFEATVDWPAEVVDSTTGMPKATQVSWQMDANQNPINFAPGRACIRDVLSNGTLPSYSTLSATIPPGTPGETITIVTQSVAAFPVAANLITPTNFVPIVVDSERMNVIGQSGTSLTVKRFGGANGTDQVQHDATYPDNSPKKVMSTPFPLDAGGKVMLVCIVAESFDSADASQCSPIAPGKACVKVQTTVLGDLYVSRSN